MRTKYPSGLISHGVKSMIIFSAFLPMFKLKGTMLKYPVLSPLLNCAKYMKTEGTLELPVHISNAMKSLDLRKKIESCVFKSTDKNRQCPTVFQITVQPVIKMGFIFIPIYWAKMDDFSSQEL